MSNKANEPIHDKEYDIPLIMEAIKFKKEAKYKDAARRYEGAAEQFAHQKKWHLSAYAHIDAAQCLQCVKGEKNNIGITKHLLTAISIYRLNGHLKYAFDTTVILCNVCNETKDISLMTQAHQKRLEVVVSMLGWDSSNTLPVDELMKADMISTAKTVLRYLTDQQLFDTIVHTIHTAPMPYLDPKVEEDVKLAEYMFVVNAFARLCKEPAADVETSIANFVANFPIVTKASWAYDFIQELCECIITEDSKSLVSNTNDINRTHPFDTTQMALLTTLKKKNKIF